MKLNGKSIIITIVLAIVLLLVLLIEISLFISGPSAKYDAKVEQQIAAIQKDYQDIKDIQRHVFQYIVYIGQDDENIVWFNVEAKPIISKEKSTLKMDQARAEAARLYGWSDMVVSLGYGYNNPVYVIQANNCELLLDYDTLKAVYYFDKDVR